MTHQQSFTADTLLSRIPMWIQVYATKAGISTLVVGVSGGIDSAVVTRLCQKTNLQVCAVAMPMWLHDKHYTSLSPTGTVTPKPIPTCGDVAALYRAMELCVNESNIDFHIREIGPIVEAYLQAGAGTIWGSNSSKILQGNIRSRIRANFLYDFAGKTNGLVVGTGNLDEDEIGYFTKGGEGLVDICPLSKLHKSRVYAMAKSLNVPLSIRNAVPTAGLWDGQTDEQELGMTYAEVEWALDYDKIHDEPATGRAEQVLNMVRERCRKNAHKLHYPPVFDPYKKD